MAEQIKFGDRLFLVGEKVLFDNGANDAVIESRNGTLVIKGNLTVEGNTTTVNTIETSFADPYITLNGDHTGPANQDVGIEINRGDDPLVRFTWDEVNDRWSFEDKDVFTTGDIYGNVVYASLNGNVVSDNGVVIIDVAGNGSVDIRSGNIDGTVIGATTPAAGYFTTISGDGTNITNVLTNYTTDDLVEGSTNLYYTDERVDDRVAALFNEGYGLTSNYDDALGTYLVEFDAQNIGGGVEVLDLTNTPKASFRTIAVGDITNGGNSDLTVSVIGDEIVLDTSSKINQLAFNTFTGNGTINQYTLPYTVDQDWQVLVYIDGVVQEPTTSYVIVSGNIVTLTTNLPNGAVMNVIRMASNSSVTSLSDATTLGGQLPAYYLDYNNFTNTPTIPTVPTNVSAFTNDAGYITSGDIPTNHMVTDADNTVSGSIIPSIDATYDLGNVTNQWNVVYGHTIEATYADLAERYEADKEYDEGHVVVFGGEKEITETFVRGDTAVAGVISKHPALKMNSDAGDDVTHPYVALKGRVPCKVIGPVRKGQMLVTSGEHPGYAIATNDPKIGSVIGKALQNLDRSEKSIIEIFVSMM